MLRDEGCSIRHGVEERPERSIAASVVIGIKDAGINVHRDNLKRKIRKVWKRILRFDNGGNGG